MITQLDSTNFNEVVEKASKPVVIDVYAVWCGPCHYMMPIYEEIAHELSDSYVFTKIDVDTAQDLAIHFGVSSVPTFIFIKDNTVLDIQLGTMQKEAFKNHLTKIFG